MQKYFCQHGLGDTINEGNAPSHFIFSYEKLKKEEITIEPSYVKYYVINSVENTHKRIVLQKNNLNISELNMILHDLQKNIDQIFEESILEHQIHIFDTFFPSLVHQYFFLILPIKDKEMSELNDKSSDSSEDIKQVILNILPENDHTIVIFYFSKKNEIFKNI